MKTTTPLLFALVLASLLFCQCSRTTYTKADFPDKRLSFGSGGGFTGAVTSYHLLPNGQVFISDGLMADTTALPSIKKAVAKSLFETADNARLDTLDFNHPGNIYKFLHYYNEKDTSRVVWGENGTEVSAEVTNLYRALKDGVDSSGGSD